jgi:hypothetical protein
LFNNEYVCNNNYITDDTTISAAASKKVCQSRARVRIIEQSNDVFSDSEDENDDDDESRQAAMYALSPPALLASPLLMPSDTDTGSQNVSFPDEQIPQRKTRSGVCFADQPYNTPGKKLLNPNKKRKVTPFKPHIDDVIVSPY